MMYPLSAVLEAVIFYMVITMYFMRVRTISECLAASFREENNMEQVLELLQNNNGCYRDEKSNTVIRGCINSPGSSIPISPFLDNKPAFNN